MAITVNIDSLNVVKTAAEWALDNTVYSDNYVLWVSDVFYSTTDQMQFKKADGVQTFADLDFMPIGGGGGAVTLNYSYFTLTNSSLVDNTTYLIGSNSLLVQSISQTTQPSVQTGTIKSVYVTVLTANAIGSNEDIALSVVSANNTVTTAIGNIRVDYDGGGNLNKMYKFTGLSGTITEGTSYIKLDVPAMVTNPTAVRFRVDVEVEIT